MGKVTQLSYNYVRAWHAVHQIDTVLCFTTNQLSVVVVVSFWLFATVSCAQCRFQNQSQKTAFHILPLLFSRTEFRESQAFDADIL